MATKKEINDKIAELQAELEGADDDEEVEVWVEHPKTKAVGKLRGRHAASFLEGILGTPDNQDDDPKKAGKKKPKKAGDDDVDDDDDDDDVDDDDPPKRQSVWGRR